MHFTAVLQGQLCVIDNEAALGLLEIVDDTSITEDKITFDL